MPPLGNRRVYLLVPSDLADDGDRSVSVLSVLRVDRDVASSRSVELQQNEKYERLPGFS